VSTPKPTPDQLMQAVLTFARKHIASGMPADKVRDLLIAKGLKPAAAAHVMVRLGAISQRTTSETTASTGPDKSVVTQAETTETTSSLRHFAVQGRFLRLPVTKGDCTLPSVCVACGAARPSQPVVNTKKKRSCAWSSWAATLWALAIAIPLAPGLLEIRSLEWMNALFILAILANVFIFPRRYNTVMLTYTACAEHAAQRLRLATTGKAHTYVDGCSKAFLDTVKQMGVPELPQTPYWSFTPRPGYAAARLSWTLFLLAAGLVCISMLARSLSSSDYLLITNVARPAGESPGAYQELPGFQLWVPADWQLESQEKNTPINFRTYKLAPPNGAMSLTIAVYPREALLGPATDDANALRSVTSGLKNLFTSGYTATEPMATTLNGEPAHRIDVSGLSQPPQKGASAVPITVICVQHKNDHYVYRLMLLPPTGVVQILTPDRISNILNWVKPTEGVGRGDSDANGT
jgi:hypothetical protein